MNHIVCHKVSLSSQPVLPPTVYLAVFSEDILIRKQAMV